MLLSIIFAIMAASILWLIIEFVQSSTLNEFLDKKIMRRFLWLWLPVYALWRLSKEVIFSDKK